MTEQERAFWMPVLYYGIGNTFIYASVGLVVPALISFAFTMMIAFRLFTNPKGGDAKQ